MNTIISKYKIDKLIGEGSFSNVYSGSILNSSQLCCIKKIFKSKIVTNGGINQIQHEIDILSSLNHPNIVKFYDFDEDDDHFYLVMELCNGITLLKLINHRKGLDEFTTKTIFFQLISTLEFLHSNGISHRDIKPENIIVDRKLNIKLIDFGFSTISPTSTLLNTFCGSIFYISPECLLKKPYQGDSSDVWASGVVLFAMITGKIPWEDSTISGLCSQIINCNYTIPYDINKNIFDIITKILIIDPKLRPSCKQILSLSYFNNISYSKSIDEKSFLVKKNNTSFIRNFKSDNNKIDKSAIFIKKNSPDLSVLIDSIPGIKKKRRSTAFFLTPNQDKTISPTFGTIPVNMF